MSKAELTYQETQEQLQVQPYLASLFGAVNLVESMPEAQACPARHIFPAVQEPQDISPDVW